MQALYDKCRRNVDRGFKVYILVPDRRLQGARQNIELALLAELVAVESLESFVSQNIDELSTFTRDGRRLKLVSLLELYNQRVAAVEYDKSLMIELPENLR